MVDIIIPAYNAHETIKETLDSISNQINIENIKVYIVDDGSTIKYNQIIEPYKNKMYIELLCLNKNYGPGYARQCGLNNSNSKYIIFVDSDDIFSSNKSVKYLTDFIEKTNCDAVSSKIEENIYGDKFEYYVGFDTLHGKIYKRSFLKKHNIKFPYIYNSEDIAFNNLLIMSSFNLGQCEHKTYIYKRRKNSLTQTSDYESKHIKCYCESLEWTIKQAIANNVSPSSIGRLLRSCFSYFYYYFNENKNDYSIKNIYKFLPIYIQYKQYIDYSKENYWLDFWTIKINEDSQQANFDTFLKTCINNYNKQNIKLT